MKFPVAVYLSYFDDLQPEEGVKILAEEGLTHGDLSEGQLAKLLQRGDPAQIGKQFGDFAREQGMNFVQAHLSFAKGLWMTSVDTVEKLKPELELCAAAGIRNTVLHANGGDDLEPKLRYERVVENVRKLAEFAGPLGITLCIENLVSWPELWTADSLIRLIKNAGDKNLGICLDTGHLHLCNSHGKVKYSQGEFIRTAGSYLQAMHVVDNDGLGDTHQMPFSARYGVDWKDVVKALQEIQYPGLFDLECLGEHVAPLPIRRIKLGYMQKMCDYMFTEAFWNT